MKKLKDLKALLFLSLTLLLGMQSCSVGGLLIGSIVDGAVKTEYDLPIAEGDGWINPEIENCNLQLALENGTLVFGEYKGQELINSDSDSIYLILVERKGKIKKIPHHIIAHTLVFRKKKNRAKTGFIAGAAVDVFIVILVATTGGLNYNVGWSGPI